MMAFLSMKRLHRLSSRPVKSAFKEARLTGLIPIEFSGI